MLKGFEELRKINVNEWAKDRDGFKYLPWARAIDLLYKNGAEKVKYEVVKDANGCSLHHSDLTFTDKQGGINKCYEVVVRVTIDGEVYEETYPVMNGTSPVKDSYMSQQRVRTSVARALVKCIATNTGLGFDLWLEGEEGENEKEDDLNFHNVLKIKDRLTQTITEKCQKFDCDYNTIAEKVGFASFDEMRAIVNYCNILDRFEKKLRTL